MNSGEHDEPQHHDDPQTSRSISPLSFLPLQDQADKVNEVKDEEEEEDCVYDMSDFKQRGTKAEGVAWMQAAQARVKVAESVLVIGGGALGVREYCSSLRRLCFCHIWDTE